ncbi:hypothetical protein QZH41_006612 [Actinostola sp. cb2023]|nr:hypothetical protein QZH41_006612 [Actinostola sp. cb2023]
MMDYPSYNNHRIDIKSESKLYFMLLKSPTHYPLANCNPLRFDEDEKRGEDDIMGTIIKANENEKRGKDDIMGTIIKTNEKKVIPGVYEGDIIVTSRDNVDQRNTGDVDGPLSDSQTKRNAQRARERLWKQKIIPYEIRVRKEHNFNKYSHGSIDTLKATYDFNSIMHYGSYYFSKNGQPTLRGFGPNKGKTLGQRNGFTNTDIFEINALYDCKGYYIYAEASSPAQQGQVARLQSKVFPATAGRCMQFSYSMYGGSIGSLDVYVINVKNGTKSVFLKSGDQGNRWHKTEATIVSAEDYKISFEATRGSNYNGDIALDDIMFKDGACNTGPNPSTAVPTTARPTTARPTTARPTTARPTTARPTTARPTTARPTTARPTTVRPTTARPTTARPTTGRPTTGRPTTARPTTARPTTARPTTARPTTARPTTARPTTARPTTARPTTGRPSTARPTTGSPTGSDDCTFEAGQCFWHQSALNNYIWHRHRGSTSSSATGPDGDVTKNLRGTGYYMYAEASSPVQQGEVASLESKVFPATASAGRCMQFSYSMYGGSIGSLDVYAISVKNGMKLLFSKYGNKGRGWHKAQVYIVSADDYKKTNDQKTNDQKTNDQTTNDQKTNDQTAYDQTAYLRHYTDVIRPRVQAHHALRAQSIAQCSYVYMETSWQSGNGQTATLISPPLRDSSARCMSFFYSMNGLAMGSLNVYIQNPKTGIKSMLFTKSGDQGVIWQYGAVTIASICEHQIVFEGVRGTDYRSDIALDDITFADDEKRGEDDIMGAIIKTNEMKMNELQIRGPGEMDFTSQHNVSETWRRWKRGMEYYLAATCKVKNEAEKVAIFMCMIGRDGQEIKDTFEFEVDEDGSEVVSTAILFNKFEAHCKPRKNLVVDRHRFLTRDQASDTGAEVNVIPYSAYRKIAETSKIDLRKPKARLSAYNGEDIPVKAVCTLQSKHKGITRNLEFFITSIESEPVLSISACKELGLIKFISAVDRDENTETFAARIREEYKDVFTGIGCLERPYHIVLDPEVQPVINPRDECRMAYRTE